ncbi:unnamed protein product [Mytilus edulis]|uniref:VWA N-terminal domain-containing protein n=1 Tax=Mytilus edulis TaxID=6550 RepID=A0A8S3T2T7_MYTED|nr:unnamed protein product [Mytilus edulis]
MDNDSQTDHDSVAKRRRIDIETDIDCIILNDLLTEETDTVSETLSLTNVDSTHDKIRQIVEKNYKHSVQNTMRKYHKKMSKSNAHIVKGCFVTVRIPVVDRASGAKPKEWSEKISMKLNTSSMGESMDLVNAAETAVRDHKWREDMRIGDVQYWDAKNHSQLHDILSYNERFLQSINESVSTVHIPVEIYNGNIDILNGLKWSNDLDQAFMKNYENDPDILWQYFGSQTGFMRTFPGSKMSIKHDDVDLFDVRRRLWLVNYCPNLNKNILQHKFHF